MDIGKIRGLDSKPIEIGDATPMFEFVERNRAFFQNWIPFVSKTKDLKAMETTIERYLARRKGGEAMFYCLWDGPIMVAFILAREIDEEAKWAEIGYMIDEAYQRRGIVKEACVQLIRQLWQERRMEKIVICCNDENVASIGLAESLGFVLEGKLRRHIAVNGNISDMRCYGLFRDEARFGEISTAERT